MDDQKLVQDNLTIVQVDDSTDSVESIAPVEPIGSGTIGRIGPNFEVIDTIGEGASGIVFRARHLHLDKIVAIKVLKEEFSPQSKVFLRFQQEARTTSHLSHENIASVHDFGLTEGGHPFIVMDYIEGTTLSSLIEQRGSLAEAEALPIFQQICKALVHAHERHVIHRDLKPSNIILQKTSSGQWEVKVVDFGIAKVILEEEASSSPKLTKTGEIFGTPLYMSPEQCQGQSVDNRTDIYSLGCLMYETLIGRPPFAGKSTFALLMAQVNEAPLPFKDADKNVKVSDALERIVFRTLEKAPADRYQSVLDLLKDLELVNRSGVSVSASKLYIAPRQKRFGKMFLLWSGSFLFVIVLLVLAFALPLLRLVYENITSPWYPLVQQARNERPTNVLSAESYYRKAIMLAEESHARPDQVADIKYELGCLLYDSQPANHVTYKVFSSVAELEGKNSLRHANTLEYLARLENWEAKEMLTEASKVRKSGDSAKADALVTSAMARMAKARKEAQEAVDIKIRFVGLNHPYLENALRSQGQVFYGQGLYDKAEEAFGKALNIARSINMNDGSNEADRLYDLACCCREQGKREKADQYFQQSIKKYTEIFGADHRRVLDVSGEYQKFLNQAK